MQSGEVVVCLSGESKVKCKEERESILMHVYHDQDYDVITLSTYDKAQAYKPGIHVYSPQFCLWTMLRGKFLYCTLPTT